MLGRLRSEIKTIKEKDPAARSTLEIFLCIGSVIICGPTL